MADLTDDEIDYLASRLGTAYVEDNLGDLQDRYDRLGTAQAVAYRVLSILLSNMVSTGQPSSYTIPGAISESFEGTIRALQQLVADARRDALAATSGDPEGDVLETARIPRAWAR